MESTDLIKYLIDKIEDSYKKNLEIIFNNKQPEKLQSDELKDLYAALAKAQGEYDLALFNRKNPFFKNDYADLKAIINATEKALAKYGLSFTQILREDNDGRIYLYSRLAHESGQWVDSKLSIPDLEKDTEFGATVTYKKRYAASALLRIVGSDPEDDDGAGQAEKDLLTPVTIFKENSNKSRDNIRLISKDHLEQLQMELQGYPEYAQKILAKYNIKSLSSVEDQHFYDIINWIRNVKEKLKSINK